MQDSLEEAPQLSDRRGYWLALFVCLSILTSVLCYILVSEPVSNSSGNAHASFGTMKIGGPSDRHASPVIWIGAAYGVSQYVFLVALLLLGLSRPKPAASLIGLIGVLGGAVFVTLFVIYNNSQGQPLSITMGFQSSAAWMIYVLWPMPVLFIVLYCVKFDKWFYTLENRRRFEELLDAQRLQRDESARKGGRD
jgi:hypothetical protein